ncbi:MAG: 4'-phosphopantetheinyl transferase superfamily protein [Cycloclasticus sp.]|nr:4'-phosphopantetheinyl transferase superfamily protein [Cycloclasticus sp.]
MVGFTPKITHQIPCLKAGDVHVWKLALGGSIKQSERALLSDSEVLKISRLRNQQHRAYALSMRVQLRRLISGYLGINPSMIRFEKAEFGKPYIIDSALSFNVSHSGSQALVAMTLGQEVGVDIENWRYLDNLEGLVIRNFSNNEQKEWLDIEEQKRESTFFKIWTCKEAFIKATGRGLGMGVSRCGFSLTHPNNLLECPIEYGKASDWSCVTLDMGEKVSASLMLRSKGCRPVIYTFDPENPPQII